MTERAYAIAGLGTCLSTIGGCMIAAKMPSAIEIRQTMGCRRNRLGLLLNPCLYSSRARKGKPGFGRCFNAQYMLKLSI